MKPRAGFYELHRSQNIASRDFRLDINCSESGTQYQVTPIDDWITRLASVEVTQASMLIVKIGQPDSREHLEV